MKKKRAILIILIILTVIVATISFIISDTPDKEYLNPYYVDIMVLCAGVFLIVDALVFSDEKRFYSIIIKAIIGVSIITIHLLQFIFDITRNIKF